MPTLTRMRGHLARSQIYRVNFGKMEPDKSLTEFPFGDLASHLHKLWTNGLAHVNVKQPLFRPSVKDTFSDCADLPCNCMWSTSNLSVSPGEKHIGHFFFFYLCHQVTVSRHTFICFKKTCCFTCRIKSVQNATHAIVCRNKMVPVDGMMRFVTETYAIRGFPEVLNHRAASHEIDEK